jgi:tetratricopeptide (TPR) repeat protein
VPDFDNLWNYAKPYETEQKFRAVFAEAQGSVEKDYRLQLLTQIARTEGLQRKFDEAHRTLDDVQKALGATTPRAEIRYFLERGRVFNSSRKPDQALPLFMRAYELAMAASEDNLAVDAAHMMAIAEPQTEKKMEWNLTAISLAEKSEDPKARDWLGSLYNNMAWTYHDAGKFAEALSLFEKALAFRKFKGQPSSVRIAKWCIARTYRSMKKYSEALQIQADLEAEFSNLPEKDGYVYEELAEIFLALNKTASSKKYFVLAYEELSKDESFKANEPKRLQRLKDLGER